VAGGTKPTNCATCFICRGRGRPADRLSQRRQSLAWPLHWKTEGVGRSCRAWFRPLALSRQLLTESMLLGALGTLFGVLFAVAAVRYFNSADLIELPPGNHVTINLHVLGFAIFLTATTGWLFGLLPAWRGSQVDLNEVLKQSGRSIIHAGGHHASRLLVVGQVALSMILLAGAGLLIESIVRLASIPLGFHSAHLLTAEVALPPQAYSKLNQRSNLYEKLVAELSVVPSVEGVALCSALPPYNGGGSSKLAVAGKATIENLEAVNTVEITSDYFRVLGLPLLQGRDFDSRDRERSQTGRHRKRSDGAPVFSPKKIRSVSRSS